MKFQLPAPQNWQDFESICHKLWSEIWNDPNAQKYGRNGQRQNGIDIYGTPIYSKHIFGVQCKDKQGLLGSTLTTKELSLQCSIAKNFKPEIASFTIATTCRRDVHLQRHASQLTQSKTFPFAVHVWSWDEIQSEVMCRQSILNNYYQNFQSPPEEQSVIALNRFCSQEHFYAYFSRPVVKSILNDRIKNSLISLGYELSDNAYLHGKATKFSIRVEAKKIVFVDNGAKFNPIKQLDASRTTLDSHVGSYVFETFLKEFSGIIKAEYHWDDTQGGQNILEFNLSGDIGEFRKDDFLELYVDWTKAAGRDSAKALAASICITADISEVIWTVTDGYALSFFAEFIQSILHKLHAHQRFILSVPRSNVYKDIERWCNNDKRLFVQRR